MNYVEILHYWRKLYSLYQKRCTPVCKQYKLNQSSFDVILFLANNPQYNTARDICEIRGIKSGIVSVVVENLIQRGFLERKVDPQDRRKQRLFLTKQAGNIVKDGRMVQQLFFAMLSKIISVEEQQTLKLIFNKIISAVERMDEA